MKKKLIFGMFAAAGLLLAASCSNDDIETPPLADEECLVTFTVAQPGLATRAYSEGSEVSSLTYAAYIAGETTLVATGEVENAFTNLTASVTLSLVNGLSYDVIFWADSPDGPYTFSSEAQTVTVDYTNVASQDESLDAFYGSVKGLEITGTNPETIELKRPFAQLNIGTTDATEAATAGFTPVTSSVKVTSVYSAFDIYDGLVSGDASTVTYASAALPGSGETFPASGITATYLSMNYLLVGGETTIDIEFTATAADGDEVVRKYSYVPVNANYQTNIYGNILTDAASYTIEIVETYDGSRYVREIVSETVDETDYQYVSTTEDLAEELAAAGASGAGDSVIILQSDITFDEDDTWTSINVEGYTGADVVTIYGNGHTISGMDAPLFSGGFAGGSGIVIYDLTIADSEMTSTSLDDTEVTGYGAFVGASDSMDEITLDNCHIKNCTITGTRTGGLVGWNSGYSNTSDGAVKTYVTITNCSVEDCTIIGYGTVGGIVGHAGASDWTWNTIENCEVTNCKLISYDTSYRVGGIVGTANVGTVVINDCTIDDETTITQLYYGGTSTTYNEGDEVPMPDTQDTTYGRYYGRVSLGSTGSLTIDGTSITQ